ncbi:hypothetical protein P7K49_035738 [Saguinus oedipus]|uniref:Uncharacterized protein n=1 Tax=Saguinus oedipus TaxID=9490 RepID=A0ABQ9TNI1_SAGOE|nr:hypothetical protein P7K49_035738 [Saguinus oedipus]
MPAVGSGAEKAAEPQSLVSGRPGFRRPVPRGVVQCGGGLDEEVLGWLAIAAAGVESARLIWGFGLSKAFVSPAAPGPRWESAEPGAASESRRAEGEELQGGRGRGLAGAGSACRPRSTRTGQFPGRLSLEQ